MKFRNLILGLFAVAALSACSGNDSSTPRATASGDAAIAPADNSGGSSYAAGTPYITYSKESDKLWVDGAQIDVVNSETFAGYPVLEKNVMALRSTDKAIETKEQTLELWHGDSLFLALDLRGDTPMVITAPEGFMAERIAYARSESDQDQGMYTGSATFDLKECTVDQGGKDQGQEGKDQGQQDKGQDQGGKLIAGSDKGQGQDQDQGKQEEAPSVCKTSTVTLYFHEVKQEDKGQDQNQGKQEEPNKGEDQGGKGQDQGKQEDKNQGQEDKGQDQGKQEDKNQGQQDKGQDQGQGQQDKGQGQQENK